MMTSMPFLNYYAQRIREWGQIASTGLLRPGADLGSASRLPHPACGLRARGS
jgi:hypothetical protein